MSTTQQTPLTVAATIQAPIEQVWARWTEPAHITQWGFASDDWHSPHAENDLKENGRFLTRMEAKDGSMGFDFSGTYTAVHPNKHIAYTMDDGRTVSIDFESKGNETTVTETFDPEQQNPLEMQQTGWQMIMNNFKKYVESQA